MSKHIHSKWQQGIKNYYPVSIPMFLCQIRLVVETKCRCFDIRDNILLLLLCIYTSAISPYTTGLKALFNQSDCTGTAPTYTQWHTNTQ